MKYAHTQALPQPTKPDLSEHGAQESCVLRGSLADNSANQA